MSDFDNTNRGSIWKNKKKEKETHPDFTGTLNVDGVEYWVSAWKRKEGASEKAPALSFTIKLQDEQTKPEARQPSNNVAGNKSSKTGFDDFEDDIPF